MQRTVSKKVILIHHPDTNPVGQVCSSEEKGWRQAGAHWARPTYLTHCFLHQLFKRRFRELKKPQDHCARQWKLWNIVIIRHNHPRPKYALWHNCNTNDFLRNLTNTFSFETRWIKSPNHNILKKCVFTKWEKKIIFIPAFCPSNTVQESSTEYCRCEVSTLSYHIGNL